VSGTVQYAVMLSKFDILLYNTIHHHCSPAIELLELQADLEHSSGSSLCLC
jgi:hypothetical protein